MYTCGKTLQIVSIFGAWSPSLPPECGFANIPGEGMRTRLEQNVFTATKLRLPSPRRCSKSHILGERAGAIPRQISPQ